MVKTLFFCFFFKDITVCTENTSVTGFVCECRSSLFSISLRIISKHTPLVLKGGYSDCLSTADSFEILVLLVLSASGLFSGHQTPKSSSTFSHCCLQSDPLQPSSANVMILFQSGVANVYVQQRVQLSSSVRSL